MIRIRAKRKSGFRRAGLFHPAEPVDHPADRFSAAELESLKNEPMLRVEEVPDEDAAPSGGAGSKPAPANLSDDEKELALLLAAEAAIADGDITNDGKPTVAAMEKHLGHNIDAADRNRAYAAWQQREASD